MVLDHHVVFRDPDLPSCPALKHVLGDMWTRDLPKQEVPSIFPPPKPFYPREKVRVSFFKCQVLQTCMSVKTGECVNYTQKKTNSNEIILNHICITYSIIQMKIHP